MIQIIPFSLPFIEEEEKKEILDALKSGWITSDPKVKQFEIEFSKYIRIN